MFLTLEVNLIRRYIISTMRFILKVLLAAVAVSVVCGPLPTLASATLQQDCGKAENQVIEGASPKNWRSLYSLFKRFGGCDDGAIGEGFSEDVAQLLLKQWTHLDTFNRLATADKAFEQFVLRHIDATLSEDELKVIVENSAFRCPAGEKRLCGLVSARASESLDELRKALK